MSLRNLAPSVERPHSQQANLNRAHAAWLKHVAEEAERRKKNPPKIITQAELDANQKRAMQAIQESEAARRAAAPPSENIQDSLDEAAKTTKRQLREEAEQRTAMIREMHSPAAYRARLTATLDAYEPAAEEVRRTASLPDIAAAVPAIARQAAQNHLKRIYEATRARARTILDADRGRFPVTSAELAVLRNLSAVGDDSRMCQLIEEWHTLHPPLAPDEPDVETSTELAGVGA